ncbi:MAG: hypothetical protein EA351_12615 [Gemmatimonadales bacterium]|nr:MAG: hypothetical protein EA351_12615 [Gemmatimonadales bacterium]
MLPLPPVPVPDAAARRLSHVLDEAGYTALRVRAHLGLGSLFDLGRGGGPDGAEPDSAVAVLVTLLLRGRPVARLRAEAGLGTEAVGLLEEAGLIRSSSGHLRATVLLYPVGPIRVASDLTPQAPGVLAGEGDGGTFELPADAVYPALAAPNRSFLADLPTGRRDGASSGALLDLCGGTGVGALLGLESGLTRAAVTADSEPRATAFARFNAVLNGWDVASGEGGPGGLRAVTGDLWDPVAGHTFQWVLAHPPYLPSVAGDHAFRDGGPDGERLFRRILAGLPDHLDVGGLFYGHGLVADRRGAPAETRVRALLGTAADAFDLWLLEHEVLPPETFVVRQLRARRIAPELADRHLEALEELKVDRFVRGSVFLHRRAPDEVAAPLTVRRPRAGLPDQGELDPEGSRTLARFRDRHRHLARAVADGRVGRLRPRPAPGARIVVTHEFSPDTPSSARVEVGGVLPASVGIPPAALPLLQYLDGVRTARELRDAARADGAIPEGVSVADIRTLILGLLDAGVLDAFPEGVDSGDGATAVSP